MSIEQVPTTEIVFKETIYDSTSYICPTWQEMGNLNFDLARQIIESRPSNPPFDRIVALARGGWTWARGLADSLDVPDLSTLRIQSYTGVNAQAELKIVQPLTDSIDGERVLIFDEVVDHGPTLTKAVRYLGEMGPKEIRTAGLCIKPHTSVIPDYYAFSTSAWVVFPHEIREFVDTSAKSWSDKGLNPDQIMHRLLTIGLPHEEAAFYLDLHFSSAKVST